MTASPEARLDEHDRDEWRDVARVVRPDWTEAQFDAAWAEFVEMKRRKGMQ
jgi:hypothetical protein